MKKGLYFLDTRIISNWAIYTNGAPCELLTGGPINYHSGGFFSLAHSHRGYGPIPPRALGLTISRSISSGLHEDLEITNNSMKPVHFQLAVAFRSDLPISSKVSRATSYAEVYGFDAQAARVAHDASVAASHFLLNQLPELYTAPERSESNFPVQYRQGEPTALQVIKGHPKLVGRCDVAAKTLQELSIRRCLALDPDRSTGNADRAGSGILNRVAVECI